MSINLDVRPGFDLQDVQHCLKLNICRICRNTKELGRSKKHYCEKCSHAAYQCGQEQVKRDRSFGVVASPYAATVQCKAYQRGVRCKTMFQSEDKRRITRCPRCRSRLYALEESLASEECRYEVDEPRQGSVYEALQRKLGRPIMSADFRVLEEAERKANYVGIRSRSLSRAEIAKQYTPEKIAMLLVRAKRNTAGMYLELMQL